VLFSRTDAQSSSALALSRLALRLSALVTLSNLDIAPYSGVVLKVHRASRFCILMQAAF
jgi:hypothetical protein